MAKMVIEDLDAVPAQSKIEIKVPQVVLPSTNIPPGYLPMSLSTDGRLGIPALIHCRNFQLGDLYDLSLFNDEILPDRVIAVLNSLIFEKGIDVSLWPDKAIIELMVRIYINFFTPVLQQIPFPWSTEDLEWLRAHDREEEAKALEAKKWIPRIDLNLTTFGIDNLDPKVKSFVRITKKNRAGEVELNAKFLAYPRYGDTILVRELTKEQWSKTDKTFAATKLKYDRIAILEARGEDISVLNPNEEEFLKWQLYEAQKASWLSKVTLALYLVEVNGKDLTSLPLQDKISFVSDALFDVNLATKLNEQYEKLKFGVNSEVRLKNPITGGECTRHFTFQVVDLVQAISQGRADGYDVSYDD